MIFNSVEYIIFFPVCVIIYYILPNKYRNVFLLASSYYFYMSWEPRYALLLLFSSLVTWLTAILVETFHKKWSRKLILLIGILLNLNVLFVFKYYNFFMDLVAQYLGGKNIGRLQLLLPVGISFYTFQAIGYVIDVYRGEERGGIKAEKNLLIFTLFISFFPQLVAGPIERSSSLLPQFREHHVFSQDEAISGLRIILVGMFKKVVIADMFALYVDYVYSNFESFGGLAILLAMFLFTIQIYCDFSGYSDIARGSAKILGFRLRDNFNAPYMSASMKEFWNRWHISLSTWFRDYIYIPLGGGEKGFIRKLCNLMIVFLVSGLWHGAAKTFVLWGILHGIYRIWDELAERFLSKKVSESRIRNTFRIGITFTVVLFTWNIFRADTIYMARSIYKLCFQNLSITTLKENYNLVVSEIFPNKINMTSFYLILIICNSIIMFLLDYMQKYKSISAEDFIAKRSAITRWVIYYIATILIMFCFIMTTNEYGQAGAFVYFQF